MQGTGVSKFRIQYELLIAGVGLSIRSPELTEPLKVLPNVFLHFFGIRWQLLFHSLNEIRAYFREFPTSFSPSEPWSISSLGRWIRRSLALCLRRIDRAVVARINVVFQVEAGKHLFIAHRFRSFQMLNGFANGHDQLAGAGNLSEKRLSVGL